MNVKYLLQCLAHSRHGINIVIILLYFSVLFFSEKQHPADMG